MISEKSEISIGVKTDSGVGVGGKKDKIDEIPARG